MSFSILQRSADLAGLPSNGQTGRAAVTDQLQQCNSAVAAAPLSRATAEQGVRSCGQAEHGQAEVVQAAAGHSIPGVMGKPKSKLSTVCHCVRVSVSACCLSQQVTSTCVFQN